MEALEKEWKNGGEGKKSRALLFCSRHQLRISSVRCSSSVKGSCSRWVGAVSNSCSRRRAKMTEEKS